MDRKAWIFCAAFLVLLVLLGVALYRAVSATSGALDMLLSSAVGKPVAVAVAELGKFVRTDLFLGSSDEPLAVAVYGIGKTPTPVTAPYVIAGLGVDDEGIVREVIDIPGGANPTIPTGGAIQIVALK